MKSLPSLRACFVAVCILLLSACSSESPLAPSTPDVESAVPEWLVYSPDGADPAGLLRELGVEAPRLRSTGDLAVVRTEAPLDRMVAARKGRGPRWFVERNDPVLMVEHQEVLQSFFESWTEGEIESQTGLDALDLSTVHGIATGAQTRVAIVDTGIDPDHPYLAGHVEWTSCGSLGYPVESSNGLDDDGDGQIDEGYGHGTHVAGLVLSVAPDAILVPIKIFFDDAFSTEYHLALALQELESRDVDVVNLSVRLSGYSPTIASLIASLVSQGKLVVAAAGNQSLGTPSFPASLPEVLAVTATDENDALATFANFGDVELGAAGVGMLSCYPGEGTSVSSGTSMSCAVVSGALALLVEAQVADPVGALRGSAIAMTPVAAVTSGRIDPAGALGLR